MKKNEYLKIVFHFTKYLDVTLLTLVFASLKLKEMLSLLMPLSFFVRLFRR